MFSLHVKSDVCERLHQKLYEILSHLQLLRSEELFRTSPKKPTVNFLGNACRFLSATVHHSAMYEYINTLAAI